MKETFGYARVSTVKQGEGVSLEVQQNFIEQYAQKNGLKIIQWFIEKETAAKQGRPLFNAMMKLLKERKASGVIMHKIDRGARNFKDWTDLSTLSDEGIEVHFAHESLDMQARGGRLSADIQAVIAADYIRNLRPEAIKGIYGRLEQGFYPFDAPAGYLNNGKAQYKTHDPVQAPLIKKAFELYATKQYSLRTLTVHMNNIGLRNVRGGEIIINAMWGILTNKFYVGIMIVKGKVFKGGHEELVSAELFEKVQKIMKDKTNQKSFKHDFVYRKFLRCGICNIKLSGELQKGTVYYRCHTQCCVTKGIKEVTVKSELFKLFSFIQLQPTELEQVKEIFETEIQFNRKRQEELLASVRLQLGQLDKKIERLTDAYLDERLDKEMFERRKEGLLIEQSEKKQAESKVLGDWNGIIDEARKIFELANNLIASHEMANPGDNRNLLETLTSNFSLFEKSLVITMRKPFSLLYYRFLSYSGGPELDKLRTSNGEYPAVKLSTVPTSRPPLTREQLQLLVSSILTTLTELNIEY